MAAITQADLALTVDDLKARHPRIEKDLWSGVSSYANQFTIAWQDTVKSLQMRKWDMDKVLATTTNIEWMRRAVIFRTLENVFTDWVAESGDTWSYLAKRYAADYREMIEHIRLEYDADGDGSIADSETDYENETEFLR